MAQMIGAHPSSPTPGLRERGEGPSGTVGLLRALAVAWLLCVAATGIVLPEGSGTDPTSWPAGSAAGGRGGEAPLFIDRGGESPATARRGSGLAAGAPQDDPLGRGIQATLQALAELASRGGPIEAAGLERIVSDDFSCAELRPDRLQVVFRRGGIAVQRSDPRAPAAAGVAGRGPRRLRSLLEDLFRPFDQAAERQVQFQVFRITPRDGSVTASAYFDAAGRAGDRRIEQNAVWTMRWRRRSSGAPLLERIEVERFEEVVADPAAGASFSDATWAVLGNNPDFGEQFLPGVDYWLGRLEDWIESDGFGHHGIALGDVDGDGLDDLYLCEMGGLPNRLYVQQADGTARDRSARAGVDWLERSRSALVIDFDNDGDEDLAVATSVGLLFLSNDGTGRFAVRSRLVFDKEGASIQEPVPRIRTGGAPRGGAEEGHFSRSGDLGTARPSNLVMMAAADYDNDGFVDIYACTYHSHDETAPFPIPVPYQDANNGGANLLLRNEGDWRFSDVTARTGLDENNHRFSFAASWEDYDNDGDQDLYVANDFGRNNLYRNDGGRFHDVAAAAGVEDIGAGMSVSWGDYDNDGWMDLYVGNMFSAVGRRLARQEGFHKDASETTRMQFQRHARGNSLYHNNGDGTFSDVSESAGVTMGRWAWDSRFVDVDNNGWEDLFVANGYFTRDDPEDLHDFFWRGIVSRSPNGAGDDRRDLDRYAAAWRSLGRMIRAGRSLSGHERDSFFLNIGGPRFAFAPAALGLDFPDDGRAVAVGDWDLDGDLDLWVVNRTGPRVRFVRNDAGRTNRFVAFRLQGASGNRDAIGARLELRLPGGARRIRTLHAGAGYLSQSSKWVHFGLGDASGIERLVVDWPGGSRQEFDGVEPDHFYRITQGQAGARVWIPPERPAPPPPAREPVTPSADRSSIIFSEPVPSPILRYEDLQGRDVEYDGASSDPLLVGLWATRCAACAEQLGRFVARAGDLKAAGVRVLALNVDEFVGTTTATPAVDRELLDAFGRVFEAGRAKGALLDKIALLQRHLLASPSRLPVPSSLLIDRQGFLAAIYKGPVPIDRFLADLPALSTPGEKRLAKAIPFTGLRQTRGMPPFFEAMDAVARAYADGGFPEEAVAYYRKVLRIKPDRTRTHFDLADLLAGMGKTSEAIEQYRATLALDPNHLASLNNLGYLLARQGRTDQAVVMYRRALSIDSDNVSTLDNLAAALRTQGKTEEAITLYRKALRIDPDRATSLNNLAVALARQGHEEEALALYRRLLVQDADNVAARINLAMALIRQEKIPEAVDLLQAAVEKNPDSPEARYYLGFALLQQGRPEAAAEHLGQAVRLKPGYVRALYYLAIALAKRGDLDEAAGAFAAALQLQADDPAASLRLARLLATHQDAAMRDGSRAVQMARRVPEGTVSSRVEYLDTLAAALAEAGRFDEAVETAGEAVDAAERTGDAALAGQIRDRLQLYRRRHPYHDPPRTAP